MSLAALRSPVRRIRALVPEALLVVDGDGSPDGIDSGGAVPATVSGPLRYGTRPPNPPYTLRYPPPVLVDPEIVNPGATTTLTQVAMKIVDYAPGTTFLPGQYVEESGGSYYRCIAESTGNLPASSPAYFEPIAQMGLDNTKDYVIELTGVRTHQLEIKGGRNIILRGGQISPSLSAFTEKVWTPGNRIELTIEGVRRFFRCFVETTATGNKPGVGGNAYWHEATMNDVAEDAGILVSNGTVGGPSKVGRIVHIEGVLVDNPNDLQFDGIDPACPGTVVQIQNCRIPDIQGERFNKGEPPTTGVHGDIIQNQGGCLDLRVDHVTGGTNYQGFFWVPGNLGGDPAKDILKASVSNVNLSFTGPTFEAGKGHTGTFLVWMIGSTGQSRPYHFENVWVANGREGQTPQANAMWPGTLFPEHESEGRRAAYDEATGTLTFPGTQISGRINMGALPEDMCPVGNCGIGYVSPGYGPAKQPGTKAMFIEEATTNVVTNPAPVGVTGYTGFKGGVVTQDADEHGNRLHVVCSGAGVREGVAQGTKTYVVAPGQSWTASAAIDAPSSLGIVLELVERNIAGEEVGSSGLVIFPGASPDRYSVARVMGPESHYAQIRVRITGESPVAGVFNVRKVQLEQKAHATGYCDGAQGAGHAWTGVADASSSTREATRVQIPVGGHLSAGEGSLAIWANLPVLLPSTYLWSAGTPGVEGQDFLGVRVDSSARSIELVARAGAGGESVVALGPINTGEWNLIGAVWKGTYLAGSINGAVLVEGTRPAPAGSLNTPVEIGGLTDAGAKADGYLGPLATFEIALGQSRLKRAYDVTDEWSLRLLA